MEKAVQVFNHTSSMPNTVTVDPVHTLVVSASTDSLVTHNAKAIQRC